MSQELFFGTEATSPRGVTINISVVVNPQGTHTWDLECTLFNDDKEALTDRPYANRIEASTPDQAKAQAESWTRGVVALYLGCAAEEVTLNDIVWHTHP